MPFKKLDVKQIVDEKRKDEEFNNYYKETENEYKLIRQLVAARKDMGMTQKDLASKAGISQQDVSRIEREKHIPNLAKFIKLLEALDLEIKIESKETVQH
jgi:DNA-binding XRE family transcriptional regulator